MRMAIRNIKENNRDLIFFLNVGEAVQSDLYGLSV